MQVGSLFGPRPPQRTRHELRKDGMAETSPHVRDDDEADKKERANDSSASRAEQAKTREEEMEESGEENAG